MLSTRRLLENNKLRQQQESSTFQAQIAVETKPPLFNKNNKTMIKPGASTVFFTVLVASTPQFIYTFTNTTLYSFTVVYADFYNVNIATLQLVQHGEIFVLCTIGLLSSKFHKILTIPNCYLVGSTIVSIFNTLIFFWGNFYYLVIMRMVSAFGYTLMYTSTAPMMNFLVKPGNLEISMAVGDLFIPFGSFLSLIISTFFVQKLPLLIFLISGILGILHSVFLYFYLPRIVKTEQVKINYIGVFLSTLGMSLIVVNCALIGIQQGILWLEIVLFIAGIVILTVFFLYNKKTTIKVFPNQIFNRNSLVFMIQILLISIGYQSINWFTPLIWRLHFNLSVVHSGLLQGCTQFISCCFCYIFALVLKKVTNKRTMVIGSICQVSLFFVLLICIQKFQNIVMLEILFVMIELFNIQMVLCIQIFNTFTSPRQYGFITGSIVALNSKLGWSLGTTMFTSIYHVQDNLITACSISYGLSIILTISVVVISFFMGTFSWERGRYGFKEKDLHSTHSYQEFTLFDQDHQDINIPNTPFARNIKEIYI